MSETPRTDVEEKLFFSSINGLADPSRNYVPIGFARTLERELNEAKKALAERPSDTLYENRLIEIEQIKKERDEWKACAEELASECKEVQRNFVRREWNAPKLDLAVTTFNQLKEKSK